jgi:acetyl-CoA carboxylase carboxyl transferase subunit alpha
MALATFNFEKPIVELEKQLEELKAKESEAGVPPRIAALEKKLLKTRKKLYAGLSPWQRVQLARHMKRPHSLDYINAIFTHWTEVHGDRGFADDSAVVTGFAHFGDQPVAVIGQQKGKDTKENLARNFGMMHPEGYRKAMRVMRMAEKFNLPIIILIDTPGAYPGIGAEERGQAEAIARNIRDMFTITVPIIIIVIGEGASGGALGIGIGDVVLMLENAWYCVISPEGCASILWRDRAMAERSAEALKLTAPDLLKFKIVDEAIPEPLGGAHRGPEETFENVRIYIQKYLDKFMKLPKEELLELRALKFRNLGEFLEGKEEKPAPTKKKAASSKKKASKENNTD